MTTFVLIHGGWRGGWTYQKVARQLQSLGYVAYAPSLAGCGEHSHLMSGDITLGTHITDIENLLEFEDLTDVTLVGHSYGGMVITGVADRLPRRVSELVYLDAVVPSDGQSFIDVYPSARDAFYEGAADNRGLYMSPPPAIYFEGTPESQALADKLCKPFPLAGATEKLRLSGSDTSHIKRTYILAKWEANPYVDNRDRFENDKAWDFFNTDVGHDVMLNAPEYLVEILVRNH
jgi:pimeloyl-ACP methyl ester carboxylesterase